MKYIQLVGYSHPISIDSIVWLEAEANYTRIHYQNGSSAIVTQPLQWFEHNLDFIRVHRSAIVNPGYVKAFEHKPGRSGWVQLYDNQIFTIARNRLGRTVAQLIALTKNSPPDLRPNE